MSETPHIFLTSENSPYSTEPAATKRMQKEGVEETHAVAAYKGGYAVIAKQLLELLADMAPPASNQGAAAGDEDRYFLGEFATVEELTHPDPDVYIATRRGEITYRRGELVVIAGEMLEVVMQSITPRFDSHGKRMQGPGTAQNDNRFTITGEVDKAAYLAFIHKGTLPADDKIKPYKRDSASRRGF